MSEEKKKIGVGFGVAIFNKKGEVLMGLRSGKSGSALKLDDVWALPGGKLDFGEKIEDGARREVKEETGIDIKQIEVVTVYPAVNEHAHFITFGLVTKSWMGEPKVMEPETHLEWRWFDVDNLPKQIYFPSAIMLSKYKRGVFYEEEK